MLIPYSNDLTWLSVEIKIFKIVESVVYPQCSSVFKYIFKESLMFLKTMFEAFLQGISYTTASSFLKIIFLSSFSSLLRYDY